MVNIVFKTKKGEDGSKKTITPKISLTFLVNYFNWFIAFVSIVILFSGYWWLIRPKYNVIVRNELLKKEEKIYDDKVAYLQQLNEVKELFNKISPDDKNKIDIILSAGKDLDTVKINLIKEISYLGEINGALVEKIVITPLDDSEGKFIELVKSKQRQFKNEKLQILTVSFSLKGVDYKPLKQILARFERNLHLMDVTKVDFDPTSREAEIELYTYYLKP